MASDHLELEGGGFIDLEDGSGDLILEGGEDAGAGGDSGFGLLLWGVGT